MSDACSGCITAYLVPSVRKIPPNHRSTVSVWIVDHCVRRHGHPVGRQARCRISARMKAHPISVVPDDFLCIDAIGLVATKHSVSWVVLAAEQIGRAHV